MIFFKDIFSITNLDSHKIINLCGIKIKLKLNNERYALRKIRKKYKENLKRLKNKNIINICFLVNDNSKWKCQSVYEELKKNAYFNVKILLTIADFDIYCTAEHRKNKIQENVEFFKKRSMNVEIAYDVINDKAIDILSFNPDIIFYQVPYNISANQDIDFASQKALCCYVPYYINQSEEFDFMGTKNWHKKLFKFYILNNYWAKITTKKIGQSCNVVPVGHPILDTYFNENTQNKQEYVIYAAHWSINLEDGLSTFLEIGNFMLSYAKKHPEFKWVFTHHPTLLFNLVDKGFMTQEEIDKYCYEWSKFAYIPPNGNYFELFKKSKCLISDCGSFRVEYYPTGKPYIYLISNNEKRLKDGEFIKTITKNYYKCNTVNSLKMTLDNILINDNDYKKNQRLLDKKNNFLGMQQSSKLIVENILEFLDKKQIYKK